jgi:hypothetical protein
MVWRKRRKLGRGHPCHPERSEEPAIIREIFRRTQDDWV